jgi:predicted AlkP superfamily pyrophosphatase or phosphodiesterase
MKNKLLNPILILASLLPSFSIAATPSPETARQVILFIWDGLRPDAVTEEQTPTLYAFMKDGVEFSDNHSSYPTFTMMNAASFATGDRAGNTGFYGNTLWHPGIKGVDAAGKSVDFKKPIFTEDYKILQDLNQDSLFFVPTLFEAVHQKNLKTVTVGKTGPAFMQDYLSQGVILDEKHVYPLSYAKQLQHDGYALPKYSPLGFQPGKLVDAEKNSDPTAAEKIYYFADGVTPNPADQHGSPYSAANRYMMKIYLDETLAQQDAALTVVWMRNPDTTEHTYGPGTANYLQALRDNDALLAQLIAELKNQNRFANTDIIIVSDHAHSSVSGPLEQFPLRAIHNNQAENIDPNGYSVSGDVRVADLLSKAGFHAYDGDGCQYAPVMTGIKRNGEALTPVHIDKTGKICGKVDSQYTSVAYKIPAVLPVDGIVVAANGGSDYFYVPSHNKNLVKKLVRFLQSNSAFGAIFLDGTRYGDIDGTLSLAAIGIQNRKGRSPDVIVSFNYDAHAKMNGTSGTEFSDWPNARGNHGSFSPVDVHNFLAANGPDFRKNFHDTLPTGNVDVAPTIAYLLGLSFASEGRILNEALVKSAKTAYNVQPMTLKAARVARDLKMHTILNEPLTASSYAALVYTKVLTDGKRKYFYFDSAEGLRE